MVPPDALGHNRDLHILRQVHQLIHVRSVRRDVHLGDPVLNPEVPAEIEPTLKRRRRLSPHRRRYRARLLQF